MSELCECGCGKKAPIAMYNHSKTGAVKGESRRFIAGHQNRGERNRRILRPFEWLYGYLVYGAYRRKLEVISYEKFLLLTEQKECHYCRAPIIWYEHGGKGKSAAYHLDRKDNTEGYISENVVVCCTRCNRGKGDRFTYEEWYIMTSPFREGKL